MHVVTGALGYTGRSIAERLIARGLRVRTLTNSPNRPNPFGDDLELRPLRFDRPQALCESLAGVDVLYNTYWVRFNHRLFTFDEAVRNTETLFEAARRAGVRRIVHVSILHADRADDLGYYRGKHQLERTLRGLGVSHAIVRPGVLFGRGDILINNIAWGLRRFPLFGMFGDGAYRLRPLHVDDMAELMIGCAARHDDVTIDAVGPEALTYRQLLHSVARLLGLRRAIVALPPRIAFAITRLANPLVRDVIVTWEEVLGLMRGLLDSAARATGSIRLSEWVATHAETLGRRYSREIARRTVRDMGYDAL